MYNYIGMALMSVFVIMMIPAAQVDSGSVGPEFWGMGSMVLFDASGNEVFAQSVHNLVTDQGEVFLIDQVFSETGEPVADNISVGAICITDDITPTLTDAQTAAQFEIDNLIDIGTNCIEDTAVDDSGTGLAVIGPLTFDENDLDAAGETIGAIGICQSHVTLSTWNGCDTNAGILFATVDISDTQVGSGETVQITYTFDISAT